MKKLDQNQVNRVTQQLGRGVPGLEDELRAKLKPAAEPGLARAVVLPAPTEAEEALERAFNEAAERVVDETMENESVSEERIIGLQVGARPVTRVRNNEVTLDFLGPASSSWSQEINNAKARLNAAIPAVGRIELNNSDYPWAGTGWLIAPGIIVTNRHVAKLFARRNAESGGFMFRPGLVSGSVSADIDFLEEENRLDSIEHPIVSVLWIAPPEESDVAFLRVTRATGGPPLPEHIELADTDAAVDAVIAAIGYPARDPSIRDQALVVQIFGDDVYDKKRLAPGKVMAWQGTTIKHDCSTLGGNSGSVLIDFATGKAVGLHRGGLLDDSANVGVPASHLKTLLANALRDEAPVAPPPAPPVVLANPVGPPPAGAGRFDGSGSYVFTLNLPLEITVRLGSVPVASVPGAGVPKETAPPPPAEAALEAAKRQLAGDPRVLRVRNGYRFKNGWITSERAIVVEVQEKLPHDRLAPAGLNRLPREIQGVGVDVRTAPLSLQLTALGIDLVALERPAKPAGYKEPPGFDDPQSPMHLARIKEPMNAIFHVSPDAGFQQLKSFFSRIGTKLTATIYEWQVNHVSDALADAIKPGGRKLKMVTQKKGVGGRDGTEKAVEDMKTRLPASRFEHVWASTQGPQRLIPSSYHIKVAVRDDEEFWLSSGNWKESNQPKNATRRSVLNSKNREWHAIIGNRKLATQFRKYIDYDFRQAVKFPLEDGESPVLPDIELFVPDPTALLSLERLPDVSYEDTLVINGEELDIQPLLTPDTDGEGSRMFMKEATAMIKRAQHRLYLQNQSFDLSDSNNDEFEAFFAVIRDKQKKPDIDVRIIFRDGREFPGGEEKQQLLLETLLDFGIDTSSDAIRLQSNCHTKGIIVDSDEVLLGSQNLTNQGALFNRDASLLVRSSRVAKFYEKIFLFDWENLAHNVAEESIAGIRRAAPGEAPPPGFRRVKLADLFDDG
jgi:hypothetical protein